MEKMFDAFDLGKLRLENRFVFPPIKLGYGNPDGTVTDRQLNFYGRIARKGPGVVIIEPVSVTPEGREHPKQPRVDLPGSLGELKKIVDVIHENGSLACLHLNHAGAAANPKASGSVPKAPAAVLCPTTGQTSEALTVDEIRALVFAYRDAAQKGMGAGFDLMEIQAGHGYLLSQFLNPKINNRNDPYGEDRLLFAREVFPAVKTGAPGLPLIVRISGNEMSPEGGLTGADLVPLLRLAEESGVSAFHVGMGNSCFSPPWYFHHGSLPDKAQMDALAWVREQTSLPLIAAGRMGRRERVSEVLDRGLADLVAMGRPLIADPDLIAKWREGEDDKVIYCGYCLQGCLHRLKGGKPLGCNLNPALGLPEPGPTEKPLNVLVAGGGPAGMSAAIYLSRRGHRVTLTERSDQLGGQFALAWKAPGKETMREGLDAMRRSLRSCGAEVIMNRAVDSDLVDEIRPDLLVWATGAVQNIPEIKGLEHQHVMTSLEYFQEPGRVKGPRVLVIGAGRTGIEIAESLGREGYEVVATKRTDPIGSMMEMITKKLALMRIEKMGKVTLMPHTTVREFRADKVEVEKDGEIVFIEPFQTVILCSGMLPAQRPDNEIRNMPARTEIIGDAHEVRDIFSAVQAGYGLALKY